MKILFVGDVFGKKGIEALHRFLPAIKARYDINIFIANGENIADGLGIRKAEYKTLMELGFHAVTLGNHGFSKREVFDFIEDSNIVRPLNYPRGTPGRGALAIRYNEKTLTVVSVMGRVFMNDPLNNPFEALDDALEKIDADVVLVDVHAEATSEKLAIAHHLDGRVDAVVGTHTHVQTNDAMRLPKGTLYMSDVGMCGAKYGILGADKNRVMRKFLSGLPTRLVPSDDDILQLNAAYIDLEQETIEGILLSD